MSKKIVITGGLGYIGTELCKIYSGISWNNEILVIDNRFISERVNQLRNWNIDFVFSLALTISSKGPIQIGKTCTFNSSKSSRLLSSFTSSAMQYGHQ